MPEKTQYTFCRICESLCGLEVKLDETDRITRVRPDVDHVATRGFACVKGLKQHRLYASPDRVEVPLKRVGDRFERISWEQALAEIGAKVKQLRGDHGPDSVGMYVGTAAGFSLLHPIFAQGFMNGVGSKSMYASATQDCSNKFAVARELYGFPFTQPFPDLDHTRCLIIVGANPVVSKWSFLQVPNPGRRLKELEASGAKIFVVDPRRTETAKSAGEHVFIRPGTDVFFYLGFLNELLATGGVDRSWVDGNTRGFDAVAALVEPWTPERQAEVTGIRADVLRRMVAAYRDAEGAALYSSTGVNMGGQGALAFWIQEVINAVSGNFDRRGGTLLGRGIVDFERFGRKSGFGLRSDRSRIGGFGAVNDAFPGGVMADEILTPGEGQLRALFVTGGNPLITMPNSERLRSAFEALELLVVIDILPTETATLAHYVLPATSPLERPDLPFAFPLLMGMQSKRYLQATERVVRPEGAQRDEATIYLDLARACDAPLFGSRIAQRFLEWLRDRHARRHPEEEPGLPQRGLMSFLLRVTGNGSFDRLVGEHHGRLLEPVSPGTFRARIAASRERKRAEEDLRLDLAPASLLERAASLDALFEAECASQETLRLITKRHVKTHNSWTHNDPDFVSGSFTTNHLYMHPADAGVRGLAHGDLADVRSETAAVRVPVALLEDLRPGTVAMPHGWGHQGATGLSVARKTTGVNVNLLAADGPGSLERVSGMARLTAIHVEVTKAAGPQDPDHWSGLPRDERVHPTRLERMPLAAH